jgi:hypothetical protein
VHPGVLFAAAPELSRSRLAVAWTDLKGCTTGVVARGRGVGTVSGAALWFGWCSLREPIWWSTPRKGFSLELDLPDRERSSVRLIVVLQAWLTLSEVEVRDEQQADAPVSDGDVGT